MGSIGIGFAGGFGVLVLSLGFGLKPGSIPIDVILIIMSVIAAIAAMQVAGGLDYLVYLAEKILRSNPKYITFYAPMVTYVMTLMVLWVSGIASGLIDNIPFTITMIPVVHMMLAVQPIPHNILWWALSLGACLGGNLTMIGASANIISAGMLKKQGHTISFAEYTRRSAPGAILSLAISSAFLMVFLWVVL